MAYGDEVRRTDTYVERTTDGSSYIFPVVALLVILGLGAWFASSYQTAPVTNTPTVTTPAPAPAIPAPTPPVTPATPK